MTDLRKLAVLMVLCIALNVAILVWVSFNAGNLAGVVICLAGLAVVTYRLRHPW